MPHYESYDKCSKPEECIDDCEKCGLCAECAEYSEDFFGHKLCNVECLYYVVPEKKEFNMNKKELKEYLKDNLRLEVCLASSYYGTNGQVITILLENEVICRDTVHIPSAT